MPDVSITLTFDPTVPGEAGAVLDGFSHLLAELAVRGVRPQVLSPTPPAHALDDPPRDPDPDDDDPLGPGSTGNGHAAPAHAAPPAPAASASAKAVAGTTPPAPRVRDRTAERRAAREKAEKEAAAAAAAKGSDADDPLLGGSGGPGGGDPFGDDDAPLPPGSPAAKPAVQERVRTPKECMDGSIVILRQCFRAAGGSEAVKQLQKEYKVSKFVDLPESVAPGLWKKAVELAGKLNVEIPAGL